MHIAPNRVRWRLALGYALSLTLIFLLFSACLFFVVRAVCMAPIHTQLDQQFATVQRAAAGSPGEVALLDDQGVVAVFRIMENGRPLYATHNWQVARIDEPPAPANGYRRALSASGRHYFLREATLARDGKTLRISVAQDIEQAYDGLHKLVLVLLASMPAVLLISLGGGYWFAGRVLAPVRAIAHKAQEITAERLAERLPVADPRDEFGHLAGVFNDTFARLEQTFERMRRFTADASHELRTPLTIIRSLGENALQQPHTPAHYADTISSMLEETERLAQLLDGLLTLTRAEAGQLPLNKERVDLVALAEEVTSCLCVLAEEKQQQLQLDGNAAAHTVADHATLRQALINLVANAIRYTPEHGSIRVTVRSHPQYGGSLIEVSDNGPGIAAEHQGKVFERFYRIEADRSRASGGAGLGLALARWFAELNGGVIELESQPGRGCLFRIRLEQTGPA